MGDENAPCLAAAIPPGFIPPKLSRGLVRERRVGGLKPLAIGAGVQSLLAPVPFELVRSPTHHFPSRLDVIRFEEATNWRGKWWVGLRARLSGHPFQEKLN